MYTIYMLMLSKLTKHNYSCLCKSICKRFTYNACLLFTTIYCRNLWTSLWRTCIQLTLTLCVVLFQTRQRRQVIMTSRITWRSLRMTTSQTSVQWLPLPQITSIDNTFLHVFIGHKRSWLAARQAWFCCRRNGATKQTSPPK